MKPLRLVNPDIVKHRRQFHYFPLILRQLRRINPGEIENIPHLLKRQDVIHIPCQIRFLRLRFFGDARADKDRLGLRIQRLDGARTGDHGRNSRRYMRD